MKYWRAQHQIQGHSPHEPQFIALSESDRVHTKRIENFFPSGNVAHPLDSVSDNSTLPPHVSCITDSTPLTSSAEIPRNDSGDLKEDVNYDELASQFQLMSTKPFQNSLCARHALKDSAELLSAKSEPDLQVGVIVGTGLAQPIQAHRDESTRGLRRVGQLPLRKLKIAREKKKETELQKRKDAVKEVARMPTTDTNKTPSSELAFENKQNVNTEGETSDELQENLHDPSENEVGHAAKTETQDEPHQATDDELESRVQVEPDEPQEPGEASIQLGLSPVVVQPVTLAVPRFTEGQRKVIVVIDQMMEEMNEMLWLGPSAWSEKP